MKVCVIILAIGFLACTETNSGNDASTCDTVECMTECRNAGWVTGECIAGSCQCTNACLINSDCPYNQICYYGECDDAWNKEYIFTVTESVLPDHQWWDGACYNVSCSAPTPMVSIAVDDDWQNTTSISETYNPVWNEEFTYMVHIDSVLNWRLLNFTNLMAEEEDDPIELSFLHDGEKSWYIEWDYRQYNILTIRVRPR